LEKTLLTGTLEITCEFKDKTNL